MNYRKSLLSLLLMMVLCGCVAAPQQAAGPTQPVYHDPSFGWTTVIPSGWIMCDMLSGQFVRDLQLRDNTKLILWSYRDRTASDVRLELEELGGIIDQTSIGERATPTLHWMRYHGAARSDPTLTVEFAIATHEPDTHLVLLVARKSEADALVESVLLPAIDHFVPGEPDPAVSVLAVAPPEPDYWPTRGWRTSSPESQGLDPKQLEAMLNLIREEKIPLDSITVVRHGYVVLDVTFPPFDASDLHELHSATKSITSALVGIALNDVNMSADTSVVELFASRPIARIDERKQSMTLKHLLTMTGGLDWNEWNAAYESGTGNNLVLMIETAPDWTQYVLDRPMAAKPGETFLYNSGASHILSAVVTEISGQPASEFAAERLFTALGIHEFEWAVGPEGVAAGWANLRLHPEDLARIGMLYLHRGTWDGQQIVPADWVEESTTDHVSDPAYEYGYQWWLDRADGYAFMAGRFGQVAIVAPDQDMVVVFTSHLPDTISDVGVTRWLTEKYIFPAEE
jgi:CubicO group peptidase (beta-lactamase class C family)